MITNDEDGNRLRLRNRRYVDRKYIKSRQKLPFKQWIQAIKINASNGKVYQEQNKQ